MLILDKKNFFRHPEDSVSIQPWRIDKTYPEHAHNYNEIVLIEAGSGMHVVNDVPYYIGAGSLFYINSSDHHLFENMESFRAVNILFRPLETMRLINGNIDSLVAGRDEHVIWQLPGSIQSVIQQKILNFQQRQQEQTGVTDTLRYCLQEKFFLEILTLLYNWRCKTAGFLSPQDKICQTITWLHGNWREKIDWLQIARLFDLTLRTFQRQFKHYTGSSPQHYLIQLRLQHANYALQTTHDSLTEISDYCGFYDISHFIWCFKRYFNRTPGATRARIERA